MPLTLAHPAAAVPFRRLGLPLSALIIGSMAPDFAKIFTLHPSASLGHSLDGILWFCIPSGLLLLALFHGLIKRPLVALLPGSCAARFVPLLQAPSPLRAAHLLRTVLAIALGAFTHLAWDSFTHAYGWSAHHIPILQQTVYEFRGHEIKGYKLAQHGSTVIGMTLLAVWGIHWLHRAPANPRDTLPWPFAFSKPAMWTLLLLLVVLPSVAYGLSRANGFANLGMVRVFAGRTVVALMALTLVTLLAYSIVYAVKVRRHR